jgi:hypothetical protein
LIYFLIFFTFSVLKILGVGGEVACLLPFLSVPVSEIHSLEKTGLWPKVDMEEEQKKEKDE